MTSPSSRSRWQKVLDARRASRQALGRDPEQGDLFEGPPKKRSEAYIPLAPPPVEPRLDESIGVLMLGEAAARLGITLKELEAMIDAGAIAALPTGYTRTIPTTEVERLGEGWNQRSPDCGGWAPRVLSVVATPSV